MSGELKLNLRPNVARPGNRNRSRDNEDAHDESELSCPWRIRRQAVHTLDIIGMCEQLLKFCLFWALIESSFNFAARRLLVCYVACSQYFTSMLHGFWCTIDSFVPGFVSIMLCAHLSIFGSLIDCVGL